MRALEVRRRLTEEVFQQTLVSEEVRRKFELSRLDDPSGLYNDALFGPQKVRFALPLRLARTSYLAKEIKTWVGARMVQHNFPGPSTTTVILETEPMRRLVSAFNVEVCLNHLIMGAVVSAVQGAAIFDPSMARSLLGIDGAGDPNCMPSKLTALLRELDEESDVPLLEEISNPSARRHVENLSPPEVLDYVMEAIRDRGLQPGSFQLPEAVLRDRLKSMQAERARSAQSSPGGRPRELGPDAALVARYYKRYTQLSAKEIAKRMEVSRASVYELLHSPIPTGPLDELALTLADSVHLSPEEALRCTQAIYGRKAVVARQ